MTLREIEETLHTLIERHPGLNEVQLLTLLRAGGWEEKQIEEARIVFNQGIAQTPNAIGFLPPLQEAPVFIPTPEPDHMLLSKNEDKKEEPESLVKEAPSGAKEDLPHNLPLRPFETSDHVWPFSRYRDVFHGEPAPAQAVIPETQKPRPQAPIFKPQPDKVLSDGPKIEVHITPAPLTKGDEKLVIMASVMLVIILLLLAYMYSNGRL